MKTFNIIMMTIMMTACGSQDWRLGNYDNSMRVTKKREAERDKKMNRALKTEKNTAKY